MLFAPQIGKEIPRFDSSPPQIQYWSCLIFPGTEARLASIASMKEATSRESKTDGGKTLTF
ncbi:hypothetical protein Mapa_004682 [Marchantia paleacea]|nr:hypothetical protein Mapa_004682 [Marchantia paleacea]